MLFFLEGFLGEWDSFAGTVIDNNALHIWVKCCKINKENEFWRVLFQMEDGKIFFLITILSFLLSF